MHIIIMCGSFFFANINIVCSYVSTLILTKYYFHSSADIECKWNTTVVEVTEGKGAEVKLFSSCSRRQYSGVIPINVICVPNQVPGFVTAGLLA